MAKRFTNSLSSTVAALALATTLLPAEAQEPLVISLTPITSFRAATPDQTRFGALRFIGGAELTSEHDQFGGLSGIVLDPNGRHFIAISDVGHWVCGDLRYDGQRLSAIDQARTGPLLGLNGKAMSDKWDYDAEAIAWANNGDLLIAFERHDRIWRYRADLGQPATPVRLDTFDTLGDLLENKGIEGLAVFPADSQRAGTVVALAERYLNDAGDHTGWLISDNKATRFHLTRSETYDITDAAFLPGGDLLVLERLYKKPFDLRARLRRVAADDITTGARLEGSVIFEADIGDEIDNMEGLAVHLDAAGRTIVTLVSDDNFNFFQTTVLLQFELLP